MSNEATERARMPQGSSEVLDQRTLKNDYATLLSILKEGQRVLDVGCGTGAITSDIAKMLGEKGFVTGIDSSDHLISSGMVQYKQIRNLELIKVDLFQFEPREKYDLVVSARVMQWLDNPKKALQKFNTFLKPGGQISILDYNHTLIEWKPEPPPGMSKFYEAFLDWRADVGMDNEIADHLPSYLLETGFHSIEILDADEVYRKTDLDFTQKAGIWSKVAETRGKQLVESGYISDNERIEAIETYNQWLSREAEFMILKLKEIRGMV